MDFYLGQQNAFQVMAKTSGGECNLNCTYCYYLEKKNLYPEKPNFRMPADVLETYIKQYIQSQHIPEITFVWQGGEPTLMGLEYFKRVVDLQHKYAGNKKIANAFQTNGILLNHDWCRFFKAHHFLIGISIDGPREIHDKYRKMNSGSATWDRVMKGIYLLKENQVEFNTLTVVNDVTSNYPLEIYGFLKETGSTFHQYIPVVERMAVNRHESRLSLISPDNNQKAIVTPWSVISGKYGKFMTSIFDEWVRNDVGHIYVQMFEATLASWAGHNPGLCIYQETCGNALVLEHNGDVYSCDHYVYPENKLGNIMQQELSDLVFLPQHQSFGNNKATGLPEYCKKCEYKFACHGECPKHRFTRSPDGEAGLNYLCADLKMYYAHVEPYMQFMVNEIKNGRPASNVMGRFADEKPLSL